MLFLSILIFLFLVSCQAADNSESQQFHDCCKKAGFSDNLATKLCKYPPSPVKSVDAGDKAEMLVKFNEYVNCYTGGHDNRDCCKKRNVGKLALCQDFCNGSPSHPEYEPRLEYAICERARLQNSHCNRESVKNHGRK